MAQQLEMLMQNSGDLGSILTLCTVYMQFERQQQGTTGKYALKFAILAQLGISIGLFLSRVLR